MGRKYMYSEDWRAERDTKTVVLRIERVANRASRQRSAAGTFATCSAMQPATCDQSAGAPSEVIDPNPLIPQHLPIVPVLVLERSRWRHRAGQPGR